MSDSEIFDRKLRRVRRDRAAMMPFRDTRMLDYVSEDLIDRVKDLQRTFAAALIINAAADTLHAQLQMICPAITRADPSMAFAERVHGVVGDEDYPPFDSCSYDLIIWVGLLDTVNDVPGALALLRRALKPGGVFLCAFAGAGSLSMLRDALRALEPATQRTHPMIDVRGGGDLLARAGFARPVADTETIRLSFPTVQAFVRSLRANAATNMLQQRHPMRRQIYLSLIAELERDGPVSETLNIVTLTGWAPEL